MLRLRSAARVAAHLVVLLLAAVWMSAAAASLSSPLFDIGRPRVGDLIIKACGYFALSPDGTMAVAHALAGFKLALGFYLLLAVLMAAYDRVRWGQTDDALLDVGLCMSATASALAVVAFAPGGGHDLVGALGEIILCGMAGLLAAFGAGEQDVAVEPTVSRAEIHSVPPRYSPSF